jgi:hypothetical protein
MTQPILSLTGPQWHQEQSSRLCPLWLQRQSRLPFSVSWRSFTMSRPLQPGVRLLRRLCHPSHTLAFSRPLTRQGGIGLPKFHGVRRIEFPVAACCRPGALGITYREKPESRYPAPSLVGQVYQPLSPVGVHGPFSQVPLVSIGNRSGRSTCVWLQVAERLSLGFPPSRVPLVNAGQVDLPPLCMCSSLCEQSIRHVQWRGGLKAEDSGDETPHSCFTETAQGVFGLVFALLAPRWGLLCLRSNPQTPQVSLSLGRRDFPYALR